MHQASTSRLRDRRAQTQTQRRMAARGNLPRAEGSFVSGQPQFSFSPPAVSAFPLQPLEIPDRSEIHTNRLDTTANMQGPRAGAYDATARTRTATTHMGVCTPSQAEVRRRSVTVSPSVQSPRCGQLGPTSPLLAQEECSERIDRLLQRVHRAQQSRREGLVRMELTGSPRTPTRLDPPLARPVRAQSPSDSSGTVSTASIRSDIEADASGPHMDPLFSPRRRAATMDVAREKCTQERFGSADVQARAPAEDMRAKIERVRARRAARLKAEMASEASSPVMRSPDESQEPRLARMHSEISGTTYYASSDDGESDFFETRDNLMLFREMEVPMKDVDWDKRVYYHHVARTNERFRQAVEDVEISDCRESFLGELLGRREAARVLNQGRASGQGGTGTTNRVSSASSTPTAGRFTPAGRGGAAHLLDSGSRFAAPNQAETDAVLEWMDDESDVSSEGHSFDWTQHGFGYMEFRRRSRSSLASSSVMSPGSEHFTPRRGLGAMMANDAPRPISTVLESPLESPRTASRQPSLMDATGLEWSVTSSTARAATANFSEAVGAVADTRLEPAGLAAVAEADESDASMDSDEDWQMLSSDEFAAKPMSAAEEEALALEQLGSLRGQNHELRSQIQQMRRAVASLTQVVVGAQ
ncbi:hypothetical protein IWW50_003556 [Coemansia erecta]|nr:hypothetical protein IWW50_003556 [Coemansia erecta]